MNRPTAVAAVAAVSLALLTGCGKKAASGSPCRDAFVARYQAAVAVLQTASPTDDLEAKMQQALGEDTPKACKDLAPGLVSDVVDQVASEFAPQLEQLQAKFDAENPTASPSESPGATGSPSASPSESATPDGTPSGSPSPG